MNERREARNDRAQYNAIQGIIEREIRHAQQKWMKELGEELESSSLKQDSYSMHCTKEKHS